jgi:hypothetical protein
MVVVGALVGAWFDRRAERKPNTDATKQLGVLLASGLIVGESLLAVVFAGIVGLSGKQGPIALVGDSFATPSIVLGGVAFAACVVVLYRWIIRMGRAA